MTELPPEFQQLVARMANIQVFAMSMRATDKFQSPQTEQGVALLAEHLRYVFDLVDQNRVLAVGPLDRERDAATGRVDGLALIRADSRDEAEAIAADEPFHKAGWRINTIRSLELNMGTLVPAAQAACRVATG
jgi:uncharacterized protein YciI